MAKLETKNAISLHKREELIRKLVFVMGRKGVPETRRDLAEAILSSLSALTRLALEDQAYDKTYKSALTSLKKVTKVLAKEIKALRMLPACSGLKVMNKAEARFEAENSRTATFAECLADLEALTKNAEIAAGALAKARTPLSTQTITFQERLIKEIAKLYEKHLGVKPGRSNNENPFLQLCKLVVWIINEYSDYVIRIKVRTINGVLMTIYPKK